MINKETVRTLVNEWLRDKEYFLVDVEVTPDDRIVVEIDHKDGVWIEDCAQLSRFLEENLNRDEEDYELEVGSAGLGQPFKVVQQYVNCIGEEVEVLRKDGKKLTGILKSVDEPKFIVTVKEKKKLEGQKRPQLVDTDMELDMNDVKHTKYVLKFK
ncbi:MAG: ribosome assembly cofactor RimP [Bacteroidales bacterium]|nr:ribosome assembly cofactor RimP [Bacteroidales bacterium]MCM1146868.1 ribosome assembly cofactor RimP [Bacteroidales bacterium]MCM1205634.1 ribosome assembly cofactor RimP [Bacillota bacterium]MCM1510254.1 ribosome assembly cofactor RimP [Clostridium sp.]